MHSCHKVGAHRHTYIHTSSSNTHVHTEPIKTRAHSPSSSFFGLLEHQEVVGGENVELAAVDEWLDGPNKQGLDSVHASGEQTEESEECDNYAV